MYYNKGDGTFQAPNAGAVSAPQIVNDPTNWVSIGVLTIPARCLDIAFTGIIALTHSLSNFRILVGTAGGAPRLPFLTDSDFSVFPTSKLSFASPNFWISDQPFQVYLNNIGAFAEIEFQAKGISTTLAITGKLNRGG